jgi:geranylgeranyl diphosphate synthase, type II
METTPQEATWRKALERALESFLKRHPAGSSDGLYDPIHYLLSLGGKRIRPVLALAACEAEGGSLQDAMPSAMAVELFHNFTLMHDDIMDAAPLRRGRPTVHTKWSENAAILSGDVMYTLALTALEDTPNEALPDVLRRFNLTSREVCEGQQSDMAFESRDGVTIEEYLEMIRLKTSVLLAASAAMGARAAGAPPARVEAWYRYGVNVGLAFQIQDDYLDTFGESGSTGKQVGGDILSDKKTLLWLSTQANEEGRAVLSAWEGVNPASGTDRAHDKIQAVREAMLAAGADEEARRRMAEHVEEAMSALAELQLDSEVAAWFSGLAQHVVSRTH